ncbi:MAG: glutamyl-tRNA reductase [Chloroflexi bacterium]|nr:glutamyl-tRNA reductase [Chloroflexota bacterium]
MKLVAVGLNHKSAPVEVRERVAIPSEGMKDALLFLKRYTSTGGILSTCNRTEVYTAGEDAAQGSQDVIRFLADYHRLSPEEFAVYLYTYEDEGAVRHLSRVAAGVDSLIIGEAQILGQVRRALEASADAGMVTLPISRLFHYALRAGRRAREETAIGRNASSVSFAAVEMARRTFGSLESCVVLVLSAGGAGKLAARALADMGAARLVVANRTYDKAVALAQELGGQATAWERLPQALGEADIVISSTGAQGYVLDREAVATARARRPQRPLLLVDIAVPRDIDPQVASLPGVYLYNIDGLRAVAEANLRGREGEVQKVEAIVEQEVGRFMRWWHSLEVVPVVAALQAKADAIREREVRRTLRRFSTLTSQEQEQIEAMTRAIVSKLLHDPITALKEKGEQDGYTRVTRDLFKLDGTGDS